MSLIQSVRQQVPSVESARQALAAMRRELTTAKTYNQLRRIIHDAQAIKVLYAEVIEVKHEAQDTVIEASERIGQELKKIEPVITGRPKKSVPATGTLSAGKAATGIPHSTRSRLEQLTDIPKSDRDRIKRELRELGKEVTPHGIVVAFSKERSQARRRASRAAEPIPNGYDYRVGDCRKKLADIPDNSVPLILTDPPYGAEAAMLLTWLAQFSAAKLIDGGSLICYLGKSQLDRDLTILSCELKYWWLCSMPHTSKQRFPGKFVISGFRPIAWYVKDHRRGRTLLPDVFDSPAPDKLEHEWAQGEGGVWMPIEHLTEPKELIVDPFAGTGRWGRIACAMGRRWIGCDVVKGGAKVIR